MSGRLEAILGTVEAAVREPDALGDRSRFLEGRGLDARDERALASLDDRTFLVYRRIVRRTLASAIRVELPRTAALLGDRFDADVDVFLSTRLSRSHYLRDVAFELVDHVAGAWTKDPAIPAFALDLARHELSAFEVAAVPRRSRSAPVDASLDLEAPCAFDEAVMLRRYAYPVHELAEGQTALAPRATALLVYRDAACDLRYLELTPLAASILERALAGDPLGTAIRVAAEAHGVVLDARVLADTSALLADLAERGVLLGRSVGATTMRRP